MHSFLPRHSASHWQAAGLAALLLFGLWSSLHHTLWLWSTESDLATPWLVWQQMLQDGPRVLLRWRFALDNWLLSLIIPDCLVFTLVGGSPLVLVLQGWAVFVAASALLFLLLRRITDPSVAALASTLPLMAGPQAIGGIGFLTYAVSHEVSVLWGLGALAFATTHVRRGGILYLGGMFLCQVIGSLSDPWLTAALTLPTMLGAGGAAALLSRSSGPSRWRLLAILAVTAVGMFVVRARLLVLHALPGPTFAFGSPQLWGIHLDWTARYVAALFQIVPMVLPDDPAWLPAQHVAWLEALAPVAAASWAIFRLWRARAGLQANQAMLALTALLSAAATTSAFILSDIKPEPVSGRYVMNLVFALPLLLGCAWSAGMRPTWVLRTLLLTWCGLLGLASAVAAPAQLVTLPPSVITPRDAALARFLEEHDLHLGYGSFWGSEASAITWITHGRVKLRPVEVSPGLDQPGLRHVEPRLAQTFPSWFPMADQPAPANPHARSFFVAQPQDDLCRELPACLSLAMRSFGPADETLHLGPLPILIWNRPVLQKPVASVVSAIPTASLDQTFTFGQGGDGGALLWQGWARPEPKITWTQATRAILLLHLSETWSGDAVLEFEMGSYPRRDGTNQTVTVIAHDVTDPHDKGVPLTTWSVSHDRWDHYRAVLPWSIARSRQLWLELDVPGAEMPSRAHGGFDARALGLSVRSFTLRQLVTPVP